MKPKLKKGLVLGALGACLLGVLLIRSQPFVDWFLSQKLMTEADPKKRVVLINESLAYSPKFWNQRYLKCALKAEPDFERVFIANLIHERFNTNGIKELRSLLRDDMPNSAKSNGLAILSLLEHSK